MNHLSPLSPQGPEFKKTETQAGSPARPAPGKPTKTTPAAAKAEKALSQSAGPRPARLPAKTRVSPELEGSQAIVSQKISRVAENVLYGKPQRLQDPEAAKSAFCNDLNKEITANVDKALHNLFKDLEKKLTNYQKNQSQSSVENAQTELSLMEELLALYKLGDVHHENHLEDFAKGFSLSKQTDASLADLNVVRISGEIAEKKLKLTRLHLIDLGKKPETPRHVLLAAAKNVVEADLKLHEYVLNEFKSRNPHWEQTRESIKKGSFADLPYESIDTNLQMELLQMSIARYKREFDELGIKQFHAEIDKFLEEAHGGQQAPHVAEKGPEPAPLEKAAKAAVREDHRMHDALSESVLKKNNEVLHFFDLTTGQHFDEHVSRHADDIKQEFYKKMSELGIESPDNLNLGTLRGLTDEQLNKINTRCVECSKRLSELPRVDRLPNKKEVDLIDTLDKITYQITEATHHNQSIHIPKGGKLSDIERKKSLLGRLGNRFMGRSRASKSAMNFIMETASKAVLDPSAPQTLATAKAVQRFIKAIKANPWAIAQLAQNPAHRMTLASINAQTITNISKMEVAVVKVGTPDLTAKFPALGKAIDNLRGLAVLIRKYPSEEGTKKFNLLNQKFENLVTQASIYMSGLKPGEKPRELFEHSLKLLMNEMSGVETLVLDEMDKPRVEVDSTLALIRELAKKGRKKLILNDNEKLVLGDRGTFGRAGKSAAAQKTLQYLVSLCEKQGNNPVLKGKIYEILSELKQNRWFQQSLSHKNNAAAKTRFDALVNKAAEAKQRAQEAAANQPALFTREYEATLFGPPSNPELRKSFLAGGYRALAKDFPVSKLLDGVNNPNDSQLLMAYLSDTFSNGESDLYRRKEILGFIREWLSAYLFRSDDMDSVHDLIRGIIAQAKDLNSPTLKSQVENIENAMGPYEKRRAKGKEALKGLEGLVDMNVISADEQKKLAALAAELAKPRGTAKKPRGDVQH